MEQNGRSILWPEDILKKNKIVRDSLIISGTALFIAILARIGYDSETAPITGQSLGLILPAILIGKARAAAGVFLYILAGIAGAPFFAGGASGLSAAIGPSAGYFIGFIIAAYILGALAESGWNSNIWLLLSASLNGHIIILACGAIYLFARYGALDVYSSISVFIPGLLIKSLLAAALAWIVLFARGRLAKARQ